MQNGEPTLKDVLGVIQTSFGEVDQKFEAIDTKLVKIEKQGEYLHVRVDNIDERVRGVEKSLGEVRETMVTKEYFKDVLDEKLFDLKTELAMIIKKEDRKLVALINELLKQKVLSPESVKQILALEPYPQFG